MQILITQGGLARTRVLSFNRLQIGLALAALIVTLLLLSGAVYHFIFLKAAREGWPVVSQLVKLVVRDEIAQRDRFMRENLDAMARKVGEMQARMVNLEAMGERVTGLTGPAVARSVAKGGPTCRWSIPAWSCSITPSRRWNRWQTSMATCSRWPNRACLSHA